MRAWAIILALSCFFGCSEKAKKSEKYLVYPEVRPIVSLGKNEPLEEWLNCDKMVIYKNMKSKYIEEINWRNYIEEYPHIKFIFFVQAKEQILVEKFMRTYNLKNYSVFWDTEGKFISDNSLETEIKFISFIVNKDNKILKVSNPTLPGFDKALKELHGCD